MPDPTPRPSSSDGEYEPDDMTTEAIRLATLCRPAGSASTTQEAKRKHVHPSEADTKTHLRSA